MNDSNLDSFDTSDLILKYSILYLLKKYTKVLINKNVAESLNYNDEDDVDIGADLIFYMRSYDKLDSEIKVLEDNIWRSFEK